MVSASHMTPTPAPNPKPIQGLLPAPHLLTPYSSPPYSQPLTPHAPRPTPHAPRPTPHAPRPTPHAPRPIRYQRQPFIIANMRLVYGSWLGRLMLLPP
jgi:hypothetical protein